jgi:hypothetical protein
MGARQFVRGAQSSSLSPTRHPFVVSIVAYFPAVSTLWISVEFS